MGSVFNKKLMPACKYCRFSTVLEFTGEVICKKRGISDPDGSCRQYKYDPLKRQPQRINLDGSYTKDEFTI